ncbi:MAG: PD-(D/E)XK motif protein [Saprospiraceae bacterium]|nr:PD-(D/E)XK motif protein [Saprospiraceae bacterium]
MMTDIKQIWFEQEATSGKNVVRKRVDSIKRLNCHIGLIGVTCARMFQMELDTTVPIHNNFLRKFRGVEIQAIPFSQSQTAYTIILLENELKEIYTMFIEDIIDKLRPFTEPHQALTLINQRVNYWKKLFSRATGELLSAEKQRGLFGELFFLRLLLLNSSNYQEVVSSWRGSESANQDFSRHKNAVEIKTTKANNPSLHIANEQQLDFTAWDHLSLGLISVTETTGNLNSLAAIIEEIREMLNYDPEIVWEFDTRVELAGIGNDMIEYYNEISYSVDNRRFFCIQRGFPVILRGNLPSEGIFDVKYQIDISSCGSFEISEEDVIKVIIGIKQME